MNDEHWHIDQTSNGAWLEDVNGNAVNLNAGLVEMSRAMHDVHPSDRLHGLGRAASKDLRAPDQIPADIFTAATAAAERMGVSFKIEEGVGAAGALVTRIRLITRRGDVVVELNPDAADSWPEVWRHGLERLGLLD